MSRALPLGAVAVFVALSISYLGYFTDDSYIYATFARNLAQHGELSFQLGQHVHAATSPLWAGLAALVSLPGFEVTDVLKLLGILCGMAATAVFARLTLRHFESTAARLAVVAVFVTEPWFLRWANSGMETPLAVLLVAMLLEAGWRRPQDVDITRVAWCAGILPLVRPEGLLLLAFVGLRCVLDPRARRSARVWVGLLLPMTAWTAIALPTYGVILPATLQAKSTPLGLVPARLLGNLRTLVLILGIAAALPISGWAVGLWRRGRDRARWQESWVAPVAWAWTVALPLVYVVRDVQVVSRYLELVLPVMVFLGLLEIARLGRRSLLVRLAGVQVLVSLMATSFWIAPSARAFGSSLDAGLGDIATWLRENSEPDALVAVYDIGLLGYRADRPILDLGGLTHPRLNELRNRVSDDDILLEGHFLDFGDPAFLVDRGVDANALEDREIRGARFEPVLSRRVANLGLSRGDPVWYTLYRVVR